MMKLYKLYLRNTKKGFATNSSSYHSTMMFTEEEFELWKNGYYFGEVPFYKFDSPDTLYEEGKLYDLVSIKWVEEDGKKYAEVRYFITPVY